MQRIITLSAWIVAVACVNLLLPSPNVAAERPLETSKAKEPTPDDGKGLSIRVSKVQWIAMNEAATDDKQGPRKVRVWIELCGPLAEQASGLGQLRIEQLQDAGGRGDAFEWQSPASAPCEEIEDSLFTVDRKAAELREERFAQAIEQGVRFYVDVDSPSPIGEIGQLRGALTLRTRGRYETVILKDILKRSGELTDEVLKDLGITVIRRRGDESPSKGGVVRTSATVSLGPPGTPHLPAAPPGEEALIETQWTRCPIMRCELVDSRAQELDTTGSSLSRSQNTANVWVQFKGAAPQGIQLRLLVHRHPTLVRVRFALSDIDLREAEWIVEPAEASSRAKSPPPRAAIPEDGPEPAAEPAPEVKFKAGKVEIVEDPVKPSQAAVAEPPTGAPPPFSAAKTREGFPLGQVAGPYFAGCGYRQSSDAKGRQEMRFNFNCPAEGCAVPAATVYSVGPLRDEQARSWSALPVSLRFNFDFTGLAEKASRVADLSLLKGTSTIGGCGVNGPAQGQRLVFPDGLQIVAGQPKLRDLSLYRCVVSTDVVRNIIAIPELRVLNLCECEFPGDALAELQGAKSLRCLNLTGSTFPEMTLPRLIAGLPELCHLDLSQTAVTDRTFDAWPDPAEIEYLSLVGTRIGDRTLEILKRFQKLNVLDISGVSARGEQIRGLADSCPLKAISYTPRPGIEKLYQELSRRNLAVFHGSEPLADRPLDLLPRAKLPSQFSLVDVMGDVSDFDKEQVAALSQIRAEWITCRFHAGMMAAPQSDALALLRGAQCITLSGFGQPAFRHDTPEHYETLLAGWRQSTALAELEINDCPIRRAAGRHLADIPSLRAINLVHTGVHDWIGGALAGAKKLERLRLIEPQVGDDAVRELSRSQSIRLLDLSETGVTSACVNMLLQMPALKEVHFRGTKVLSADCEKLRKRGIKVLPGGQSGPSPSFPPPIDPWQENMDEGFARGIP